MAPFNFSPALAIPMTIAVWLIDGCAEIATSPPDSGFVLACPSRRGAHLAPDGGGALGISWQGSGGSARRFSSRRTNSPGPCRWALPGLPAGLAIFPGLGFVLARLIVDTRRGPSFCACRRIEFYGMAARACLNRISLEHIRHGAWRQPRDRATGLDRRPLRSNRHRHPDFFSSRGSRRKIRNARGKAPISAANCRRRPGFLRDLWFWRLASGGATSGEGRGHKIAHHAAQFSPGREIPAGEQGLDFDALPDLIGTRGADKDHAGLDDVTVLVWPESAFPFILSRDTGALAEIGAVLPEDTVLVTGAARADERRGGLGPSALRYFNSIQVVASGGHILESYDKVHLVPFGEYLPFRAAFDRLGLRQFVHLPGGFAAGSKRRLLVVPGLPAVAPLICYEAIFPGRGCALRGRSASRIASQRHERRMVWDDHRPLPAFRASAAARDRGGIALDPRREHRDFGDRRSLWPRFGRSCHSAPKACSMAVCRKR